MENKHNIQVSFENETRTITISNNTKLGSFAKRCLDIYDLSVQTVSGIYFYFIDANVYIGDAEENDFQKTYSELCIEYEDISHFTIELKSHSNRSQVDIEKFQQDYENFNNYSSGHPMIYYNRPVFNITNNYSEQPRQDRMLNMDFMYHYDPNTGRFVNNQSRTEQRTSSPPQESPQESYHREQNTGSNSRTTNPYTNLIDLLGLFTGNVNSEADTRVLTSTEINYLPCGEYRTLRNRILPECTSCHITLEEFNDNTRVMVLPCRHAFTENAIVRWLRQSSNKCPVCRVEVAAGVVRNPLRFS